MTCIFTIICSVKIRLSKNFSLHIFESYELNYGEKINVLTEYQKPIDVQFDTKLEKFP